MATFSQAMLQAECKENFHFLCDQMLYRGFNLWEDVHTDIAKLLHRPSRRKLILVPRDHLKTAFVTKGWSIRTILNDFNVRILIANQVWDKSREMLFEIKELLTDKSDLPKIFGEFQSAKWNEDAIIVKQRTKAFSSPTIATTGVEAEMTSTHFDVLMLDDLMGLQNCETKEQRDKVYRFYKNCLDLLEPDGTCIVVGTRWHQDDVYARILKEEAMYYDHMTRAVIENGKIIFPGKFNQRFDTQKKMWMPQTEPTMDYIHYLRKSRGSAFYSQYMNNPVDEENQLFKSGMFRTYDTPPKDLFVFMTIDPAISQKQEADYFVINVSGMDSDRNIYVLDSTKGHWTPSEAIDQIFTKVAQWKPLGVGIETVGFQKTLHYALEEAMRERRVFFSVTEVKRGPDASKEFRIKALEPYYKSGSVFHAKWMKTLEEELLSFPKGQHDDEIDALADQLQFLLPGSTPRETQPYNPLRISELLKTILHKRGDPIQEFMKDLNEPKIDEGKALADALRAGKDDHDL